MLGCMSQAACSDVIGTKQAHEWCAGMESTISHRIGFMDEAIWFTVVLDVFYNAQEVVTTQGCSPLCGRVSFCGVCAVGLCSNLTSRVDVPHFTHSAFYPQPHWWTTNPPVRKWMFPSSKGEHVHAPGSTKRHTHSAFMAHALPPPPGLPMVKHIQLTFILHIFYLPRMIGLDDLHGT